MANKKITDLDAITALLSTDLTHIVRPTEGAASDRNKKITYANFLTSIFKDGIEVGEITDATTNIDLRSTDTGSQLINFKNVAGTAEASIGYFLDDSVISINVNGDVIDVYDTGVDMHQNLLVNSNITATGNVGAVNITAEDFIASKATGGSYRLTDTTAGADLKHVKMYVDSSGHYKLSFFEDDLTTEYNIMEVHRNATSVDFIEMKANVAIGLNYLSNDGAANEGLLFDSSNEGTFTHGLDVMDGGTGFLAFGFNDAIDAGYIASGSNKHTYIRAGRSGNHLIFSEITTDAADKFSNIVSLPKDTSQVHVSTILTSNQETSNKVSLGGGHSSVQSATILEFYTAAAVNTTTGTRRLQITDTEFDFDLPFKMSTNSIGYTAGQGLSFDSNDNASFTNNLNIASGKAYKVNNVAGLTETLNFNGSGSGEVLTLTVAGGIITGRTLVP